MTGRKISIYILASFILGTLVLIYIQYNSSKNIATLIDSNEKMLTEFKISRDLKRLESNIFSLESKTRATIITGDSSRNEELREKITEVKSDIHRLQTISDDDVTINYIDALDELVNKKMQFTQYLIDSFQQANTTAITGSMLTQKEKAIADSIMVTVQKIEGTRQVLLENVTIAIDKSGKKAQRFTTVLTALVLLSGTALFWFIIDRIRKQISLIDQLNISEKKVKASAQSKEHFLANMSHEIRTPMNAILGFTKMLQRKTLDKDSKEYVQIIANATENLLVIINDILDLSKIEAGMMRIESAPLHVREIMSDVELMLKPKALEKGLQLTFEVEESMPAVIEGDAARLLQILINLVGNALKFTSHGGINVSVTNRGNNVNIINMGITVSDTGIGIDKNKLKNIFDRFQQAEDSVIRKYGGTGLGLSIVKELVLLQNGSIEVESKPGEGTTFNLTIPYKKVVPFDENISVVSKIDMYPQIFSNIIVLVVEDNEINLSLIKHLFKNWKIDFDIVNNGKEAIEILTLNKYDVILMDIQMPVMDGYTAALTIRNALKLNTPIIAMTAHAFAGEREKCIGFGMNEYIAKPIREDRLHQLISQMIYTSVADTFTGIPVKHAKKEMYKYIKLQYMMEVSNGNIEFEKTVTKQFIEAIPEDLLAIEKAWKEEEIIKLQQLAHNMKTTVSIMGLTELLHPQLDYLECKALTAESFQVNFSFLKIICKDSVAEAKHFLTTL